jgi:chromosomal replication initiation ATPase DnaA
VLSSEKSIKNQYNRIPDTLKGNIGLKAADGKLDRRYRIQAEGLDFEAVVSRVCELFKLTRSEVLSVSKQRKRAVARSVLAYRSVKELGMSASAVAERHELSP